MCEYNPVSRWLDCQKGKRYVMSIVKITRESWLKATAKAMSTDQAKELFKSDSEIETLFTDYAFHLYIKLKDKTLTKSEFKETIANIHSELITELGADLTNVLINIALIVFALQIWKNLTDQIEQDELNTEYNNFKSVLKSQKSE